MLHLTSSFQFTLRNAGNTALRCGQATRVAPNPEHSATWRVIATSSGVRCRLGRRPPFRIRHMFDCCLI